MLLKDNKNVTGVGYYQEILYQKIERKQTAIIRSMKFTGIRKGNVASIGFDEFSIVEDDKQITNIRFEDVLDIS